MQNVWIDCYAPLVGRIFLGGFFLWNGIQAALNVPAAAQIFANHGLSFSLYWALAAIIVEVLCGIGIVAGFWIRSSSLLLAFYLLIQSTFVTNFGSDSELNLFVINLGLIGGLLYVASFGVGQAQGRRK